MWNIFKRRYKRLTSQEEKNKQTILEDYIKQSKIQAAQFIERLLEKVDQVEQSLEVNFSISRKQEALMKIFQDLMGTLEGLLSVIEHLRKEYQSHQATLREYQKLKSMISNHHDVVNHLQEVHASQMSKMYEEKQQFQKEMQSSIKNILEESKILKIENQQLLKQIHKQKLYKASYDIKIHTITSELSESFSQNERIAKKIKILMAETPEGLQNSLKIIDINHLKLQNIFYYSKLRNMINKYLDIADFMKLKRTNKFFKFIIQKKESQLIMLTMGRKINKQLCIKQKNIQNYEKIFELFPSQNIKNNAIKYLYFKIKPGLYILPFLQEDYQHEQNAKEKQVESRNKKQQSNFSWRKMFLKTQEPIQKKQGPSNKFSINQLKNSSNFKMIENKISDFFGNLFSIKLPNDLQNFSEAMERQLEDLKQNLRDHKKQKITVFDWSAQLACFSKFLFLQTSELNNLLLAVFGQLIRKNRQLIQIKLKFQELKQNQGVLRNLIETISKEKREVEKKIYFIENQIVKNKLAKQILDNNFEKLQNQNKFLNQKIDKKSIENNDLKMFFQKSSQEKKKSQIILSKIREQLQKMDIGVSSSRKQSDKQIYYEYKQPQLLQ